MPHLPKEAKAPRVAEERVAIRVNIIKALDRAIEIKAAELDRSKRQLVEEALVRYLDELKSVSAESQQQESAA